MTALTITQDAQDDVTFLRIAGRLDSNTAAEGQRAILDTIEAGASRLVLDGTRLEYVSSAGLRVFLIAAKQIRTIGGAMAIGGLAPDVSRVFEMAGFSRILTLCDTEDAAKTAVQGPTGGGGD